MTHQEQERSDEEAPLLSVENLSSSSIVEEAIARREKKDILLSFKLN